MNLSDVLLKPILSEKTTMLKETANQVTFLVDPRANQLEIAKAVEKAFDVKVKEVNIVRRRPRNRKRQGKVVGQIPGWKKAYIMIDGEIKIDLFGGV